MRIKLIALAFCFASFSFAAAASNNNKSTLEALAARSVSADSAESQAAISALRAEGPAGLQAFLSAHADEIKSKLSVAPSQKADPEWERLRVALDALCKQKDCYASRLYWYTDIEQAKAAAQASGKPILSLRLLGNLDEDLSCANSRFFRITLYANQEVGGYLRDNFILHWKSVRPVPKVTIDFGDGRKLERTVTGNSIHYILDAEGRVVDALPGLYGAKAFLRELRRIEDVVKRAAGRDEKAREDILVKYHQARIKEIAVEMNNAFAKVGLIDPSGNAMGDDGNKLPTAVQAARMVMTKLGTERSLLRSISGGQRVLEVRPEDVVWMRVAAAQLDEARLDANSKALMRNKNPEVFAGEQFQYSVQGLEYTIAADTARNEYLFHTRIHQWLMNIAMANDVERLNESVYATLFLTPSSDIWLGLHPTEVYTGIERDGVKK